MGKLDEMLIYDEWQTYLRAGDIVKARQYLAINTKITLDKTAPFRSHHHSCPSTSLARQIVPSQCLAQPIAMPLAVVRSWEEQAVSIMGQTSRCCMVCLMPQSHVSCSLENTHFNMFTLDRPTCVRNRLSAFHVVQGLSAPAGWCSSALMLRCTLASRGSNHSLHSSMRAAFAVVLIGSVHLIKLFRDSRLGTDV